MSVLYNSAKVNHWRNAALEILQTNATNLYWQGLNAVPCTRTIKAILLYVLFFFIFFMDNWVLTVFPWVPADNSGLGSPTLMVSGLNLDLIGHKGGRVLHHKGVPLHHVLLPFVLHILPPVAHLVLQPGPIVLHGQQWLHNGKKERRGWVCEQGTIGWAVTWRLAQLRKIGALQD